MARYRLEARWADEGWGPAVRYLLNSTGKSDEKASTFKTAKAAERAWKTLVKVDPDLKGIETRVVIVE